MAPKKGYIPWNKGKSKHPIYQKSHCLYCGNEIPFLNNARQPRRYCTEHQRKGTHGRPFQITRYYNCKKCKDQNWIIECACGCSEIRTRATRRSDIGRYIPGHQPVKPLIDTKIEKMLHIELERLHIPFRKHRPFMLSGFFHIVDVFIKPNIVIEVDGEYWHTKQTQVERDILVNNRLMEMGFIVLRFWGNEIKKDLDGCIKKVLDVML